MQDVGLPVVPGEFGDGAGEEGETPVLVLTAIDPLGVKDGMAHQVEGQAIAGVAGLKHRKVRAHGVPPPDGFTGDLQQAPEPAIAGHDQANVMAQRGQGRGQGADNVAHPTDLDHRCTFSRSKEHPHGDGIASGRNFTGSLQGRTVTRVPTSTSSNTSWTFSS